MSDVDFFSGRELKKTNFLVVEIISLTFYQTGMQRMDFLAVKCEECDFLAVRNVKSVTF